MPEYKVDENIAHLFKAKTKAEKKAQYGIGSADSLSIKVRVVEWIRKVWDLLSTDIPIAINEERLLKEFGADGMSTYIRDMLYKRGVKLTVKKDRKMNAVYYMVTKIK
jgi:hypothetical protein